MTNISNKLLIPVLFLSLNSFANQRPDISSAIVINDPGVRVGILSPIAQDITHQLTKVQHQPDNKRNSKGSKVLPAHLDANVFIDAQIESNPDLKSLAAQLNQGTSAKSLRRQTDLETMHRHTIAVIEQLQKENKTLQKLAEELQARIRGFIDRTEMQISDFLTHTKKSDDVAMRKKFIYGLANFLNNLTPIHFDDPEFAEIFQFLDDKYDFSARFYDLRKQYNDMTTIKNRHDKQIGDLQNAI